MNPIYENRIQPPRIGCGLTPTNTTQRKKSICGNSSLGYGTLKSRDVIEFAPKICSTRNNSRIMGVRRRRLSSDDSMNLPIAPPSSEIEVFDDPEIPPGMELTNFHYHCELCDAFFGDSAALEKHRINHQIEATPAKKQTPTRHQYFPRRKSFQCRECGKCYAERIKLNVHVMKRHPAEMEIIMVL